MKTSAVVDNYNWQNTHDSWIIHYAPYQLWFLLYCEKLKKKVFNIKNSKTCQQNPITNIHGQNII